MACRATNLAVLDRGYRRSAESEKAGVTPIPKKDGGEGRVHEDAGQEQLSNQLATSHLDGR